MLCALRNVFSLLAVQMANGVRQLLLTRIADSRALRRASPAPIGRFPVPMAFSHSNSSGQPRRGAHVGTRAHRSLKMRMTMTQERSPLALAWNHLAWRRD